MAKYLVSLTAHTVIASGAPTLTELCPITWTGFSWQRSLGESSVVTVGCVADDLDSDGKARLLDLRTTPCELNVVRVDDSGVASTVHVGPVISWTINGRSLQLTSYDCLYYLRYWRQLTDRTWSGEEQATIVRNLIDEQQALSYGGRGLDTSTIAATGIYRDLSLVGAEAKDVYEAVAEIGRRTNGFDLWMSGRSVMLASPYRGDDLSATIILDARCIGSPAVAQSVAAGVIGTVAQASSSTTSAGAIVGSDTNSTVLATFGRAVVAESFNGISEQTTIDEHAAVMVRDASAPQWSVSPGLVPVEDIDAGAIQPGDWVGYSYDAGLGTQEATLRLATIAVSMDGGRETMQVGFV